MKFLLPLLIATFLLSPFSISESHAMEKPLEGQVIIIAHRGASGLFPERTIKTHSVAGRGFHRAGSGDGQGRRPNRPA